MNVNIKSAAVLGSTGSVGVQTLDVMRELGIKAEMLTGGANIDLLAEQVSEFKPTIAAVGSCESAKALQDKLSSNGYNGKTEIIYKKDELLVAIRETSADIVYHSVGGLAGLDYALAAADCGKRLGMANKEAIIAAGDMIFERIARNGGKLIPVDSEHSAIYRLSEGKDFSDIKKLILTASGGPFKNKTIDELKKVTPADALNHPTWKMGKKITIDSATLMNKGFEIIEAVRLFGIPEDRVDVVIHPQSIIHSLVEYNDNTMTAELSHPDMRDCIRYAATAPHAWKCEGEGLNLAKVASLTFREPDTVAFPLLDAAREAIRIGGTAPASLIAADEVAVEEFLCGNIGFTDISSLVIESLGMIDVSYTLSEDTIAEAVIKTKELAAREVSKYKRV